MQGHSSSSSSLLSDETRGFLTAAFDFPFDVFATRFARFGRRAFWVCCMTNFALCCDDVRTVALSTTRDLARGREIFGKGESCLINSLTVSCACPAVGRDGPAVGRDAPAVGRDDPAVIRGGPAVGGADPEVGGADVAVGGADHDVGGADPAVGGADVDVGGADPEVGGADPTVGGDDPEVGGVDPAVGGADPAVADADAAVGDAGCSVGGVGTAVVGAGPLTPVTAVCNIGASSVTNDAIKSSSLKMFSSNGQIPHARKPAMAFSGVDDLWKALPTSAAMS